MQPPAQAAVESWKDKSGGRSTIVGTQRSRQTRLTPFGLGADRSGCFELAAPVPAETRQFYSPISTC
jgi:hypothetical protein